MLLAAIQRVCQPGPKTDLAAGTNTRNQLAQRGHNKPGRHKLRQVSLSYVFDGRNGLSLCHHVYPGHVNDTDELPAALARNLDLLDRNQIARDTVTLVFDKGSAALANTQPAGRTSRGGNHTGPWQTILGRAEVFGRLRRGAVT